MEVKQRIAHLKNIWQARDARIAEMYELRRLTDTLKKTGYESAVSNDPKNMIRLAVYLLSALPIKHRIPSLLDEAEQEKAGISERALVSLWKEKDQEQRRQGRRPWRWELSDFLCMTGWYAVLIGVIGSKKKPEFLAEILNPGRVYPGWGDDGLSHLLYEYEIGEEGMRERGERLDWDLGAIGGGRAGSKGFTVSLLWEQEEKALQSVAVQGKVVAEKRVTEFDRIPITVGIAGGEGIWGGFSGTDFLWTEHYGESLLEANYDISKAYNRWLTYHLQLAREAAQGPIKHGGGIRGSVTGEDVKAGKIVDLLPGEDLQRMEPGQVPADSQIILSNFQSMMQRGGFPWTLFGSTGPLELSGFAISQLLTAAYSTIGEQHESMENLIGFIDTLWLNKYKEGKYAPLSITSRSPGIMRLVREEFSWDKVPEVVDVEATFQLAAPRDLMERLAAARQAQPDGRLLDRVSVLEEIMNVDDPQLVLKRMDNDEAQMMPEIKQIALVGALRRYEERVRENDPELADIVRRSWETILMNLGGPPPQEKGTPGIPMGVMPPEARGKPRSLAQEIFGTPPPQAEQIMERGMPAAAPVQRR